MGWFEKILGGTAAAPIKAIGDIVDNIHTSDEEKKTAEIKLQEVSNSLIRLQAEITKTEAAHRSVFVAGWRPAVGWCCALVFLQHYVIGPIAGIETQLSPEHMENILYAMMGVAGLRTVEKAKGLTR
jgi:hypothetical protein